MGCGEPLFVAAKGSDGLLPLYDVLHEHADKLGGGGGVVAAAAGERTGPRDAAVLSLVAGGGDVVTAALSAGAPAAPLLEAAPAGRAGSGGSPVEGGRPERPIRVAIIGRPNVGEACEGVRASERVRRVRYSRPGGAATLLGCGPESCPHPVASPPQASQRCSTRSSATSASSQARCPVLRETRRRST